MTRRAIATTALAAGALLIALGSLSTLYGMEQQLPGRPGEAPDRVRLGITGWGLVREPEGRGPIGENLPTYGHALALAALLVAVGAVLQLRAPRSAAVGRGAAVVGAGLVAGVAWAVVETWSALFRGGYPGEEGRFVGSGTHVLGAAVLLVLAGAVVGAEWPARVGRPTGPSVHRVGDDDTPPLGIAVPVSELGIPQDPPRDERDHPTG
ncbi:hypothetical protein [Saccharothrix syringae]|uniref:Uncharacterized protein n=1 Tax=Saccharothrix syringae TaxID=103733 RepID=A0A5Q0H8L3_SACSY|nr:hypothetical protein [Saccharothrix syringae]QFZ22323.1 hypothetical protein EKG83_37290 [Saccharothrix syringae]